MSLQLAAQHLASHGRGDDKVLVHMTPKEVKSLNDLAMAHGGQLTINPQTGLPEAGFLSMILPMVAGAALGPAGMGLTAMQAGLAVGAGSYLLNPKGGLMGALSSGLGGYGGAGIGAGLGNLGATSEAGLTGGTTANQAVEEQLKQLEAARAEAVKQQVLAENAGYGNMDPGASQQLKPYTADELAQNRATLMNEYQATAPKTAPQSLESMTPDQRFASMGKGIGALVDNPSAANIKQLGGGSWTGLAQMGLAAAAPAAPALAKTTGLNVPTTQQKAQVVPHYRFTPGMATPTPVASATGVENTYFPGSRYTALSNEEAASLYPGYPAAAAAGGGLMGYAGGGPVEQMSNQNAIGANTGFPQAYLHTAAYSTPYQTPMSQNVLTGPGDVSVDPYTGEQKMATGGLSDAHYNLGGYSDGGRLLRGPGDGVSDSIPAVIGKKQPARLADGEFVVPARIVSELGNGSTEAGARKLYAMMDRVQASRKNTVGKGKVAKNNRADKYLPA